METDHMNRGSILSDWNETLHVNVYHITRRHIPEDTKFE
jgi:hypothetical protein